MTSQYLGQCLHLGGLTDGYCADCGAQISGAIPSFIRIAPSGSPGIAHQNSPLPTEDKARKELPLFTFLTQYFPDAFIAMVRVSVAGNRQHNPELAPSDIKWAREKSKDQLNTAQRHLLDYGTGTKLDSDGEHHLAKAAWRILAQLQLDIEASRK